MNFTESKSTALAIFGQVGTESSHGRKSEPSAQEQWIHRWQKLIDSSNTIENQEWQRAVQLAVNPIHLHHNSHFSPRFQCNDVLDSPVITSYHPPAARYGLKTIRRCRGFYRAVEQMASPSVKMEPFYAARHKAWLSPYTFVLQRRRLSILSSKIFSFFQ